MQATAVFCTGPLPCKSTKSLLPRKLPRVHKTVTSPRIVASATPETSSVDYSSTTSVFPAEACDTVGGEACDVEMFPEVKPPAAASSTKAKGAEDIDRDYLEYNEPKTVFPGEACDDLGGEFCEPEYQEGVYQEKTFSK